MYEPTWVTRHRVAFLAGYANVAIETGNAPMGLYLVMALDKLTAEIRSGTPAIGWRSMS